MEQIQSLFFTYGYPFVFAFMYCGLIGIPAAEESFMIFVGVTLSQAPASGPTLSVAGCIAMAVLGSVSGMVTAFLIGYYIGKPFMMKYGRLIRITPARWEKAGAYFQRHAFLAIAAGYFIPGVRQINPYLAGLSRASYLIFFIASLTGALIWATLFILLGFFAGSQARRFLAFSPVHVILIGLLLLIGFITITVIRLRKAGR
ncbi:DedA family protein [Sporolactobacillus vineae]|uniref:DedA family protein n=1 Tax=Sporolactobacillus vineae TaxID=444463 RepID=UPI0002F19179|nr:DedA family protein [Sporolactobacillus vineae]